MHLKLYNELRINTLLLQFYGYLTRGFFTKDQGKEIIDLIEKNIHSIELMKDPIKWDNKYEPIKTQLSKTKEFISISKDNLRYKQICNDSDIANFIIENNYQYYDNGIALHALKPLLNIEVMFKNGYFLHDMFCGYPEKGLFRFQIDCVDYLHSAAHFYNEAYDYYHNRKEIKCFNKIDINTLGPFEFRRIQSKEEVMFRNFREAYINIIFFSESFINSVGFDALLSGIANSPIEELQLTGIQSKNKNNFKNYSSLRQKIENISRIISGTPVDTKQEPFKSFLELGVELRNQYVHSSPDKGKIMLGIDDWKNKCDKMINNECFAFLNRFWEKCYPKKIFPKVIFNEFYGNSFKGHQGRSMVME